MLADSWLEKCYCHLQCSSHLFSSIVLSESLLPDAVTEIVGMHQSIGHRSLPTYSVQQFTEAHAFRTDFFNCSMHKFPQTPLNESFLCVLSMTSTLENVIFYFTHSDAHAGFIYKNITVRCSWHSFLTFLFQLRQSDGLSASA